MLSVLHKFCCGFVIHGLYRLRYVPSVSTFWRVFTINGFWILSKAFSVSVEIIIWFLFFSLLVWCTTLINSYILKWSIGGYLVAYCLASMCLYFVFIVVFFLYSNHIALWSEKILDMISVFLNLLRLDLWPNMWYILKNVPCALEKKVYYLFSFWMESPEDTNNYLKCKGIRCTNQEIQTDWMGTKSRPMYMLPTSDPLQT